MAKVYVNVIALPSNRENLWKNQPGVNSNGSLRDGRIEASARLPKLAAHNVQAAALRFFDTAAK